MQLQPQYNHGRSTKSNYSYHCDCDHDGAMRRSSLPNNFRQWLPTDMITRVFVLCGFVSAGLCAHQRRKRTARIVVAFATVAAVAGCGGAGVSTGGGGGGNGGTPRRAQPVECDSNQSGWHGYSFACLHHECAVDRQITSQPGRLTKPQSSFYIPALSLGSPFRRASASGGHSSRVSRQ